MQDRVPLYPGRVTLTPVAGQPNTYDMVRADQPTQNGTQLNKASLLTDATAALFGLGTDAVPDDVLSALSSAALYKTIGNQAQVGTLEEGSIVYLNENGVPTEFYVAKQGYEPNYNSNRVLLVRKEASQQGAWNSTNVNTYDGCTMDQWFNGEYLQSLDSDVQSAIGSTNIPYTPMGGITAVQRINKSVFSLSISELGLTASNANIEGTELPISEALKIANYNGSVARQATRTPVLSSGDYYFAVSISGSPDSFSCNQNAGHYRPAFTLPTDFEVLTSLPVTGLYTPLGSLILQNPAGIVTGSYVGTGTKGDSNPTSITLPLPPKLVIVECDYTIKGSGTYPETYIGIMVAGAQTAMVLRTSNGNSSVMNQVYGYSLNLEFDGSTVKWDIANTSSSADAQLNTSGKTYTYIAFL